MFGWFNSSKNSGYTEVPNEDTNVNPEEIDKLNSKVKTLETEINNLKYIDSEELLYTSGNHQIHTHRMIRLMKSNLKPDAERELEIISSGNYSKIHGSSIIQLRDFLLKHFPLEKEGN